MNSLRAKLVLRMVLVVSLFGLAVSGVFHVVTRSLLLSDFEHELETEMTFVTGLTKVFPDGDVYVDLDSEVVTEYGLEANRLYQVWDADLAEVLDRSVWLEQTSQFVALADEGEGPTIVVSRFDTVLPDGRPARAHLKYIDAQWGWFDSEPDKDVNESVRATAVWLLVARDRSELNRSLNRLMWLTVAMAFLLPMLAAWAVRWTVKHSLKPLSAVTEEITSIRSTMPAHRLHETWPVEIRPLTQAFNALLERLNSAESRQRRFAAAAAHELRTPIAELRTVTDVALRGQAKHDRLTDALRQCNAVSHRMQETMNGLLELAKQQSHSNLTPNTSVNVTALVTELIEEQRGFMQKRSVNVEMSPLASIMIDSHEPSLRMILNTLVSNAVVHCPVGSNVLVTLANGPLRVIFDNDAPALSADDIEHLFDPFWRPATSTTPEDQCNEQPHFGLGLALAKDAAEQLGLELSAELKDARIRFEISSRILSGSVPDPITPEVDSP